MSRSVPRLQMSLWSWYLQELGASGTQSPYNHRGWPGQKYTYWRTDMHTLGSQGRLQGRDKALARRVQNQDLVQGLV